MSPHAKAGAEGDAAPPTPVRRFPIPYTASPHEQKLTEFFGEAGVRLYRSQLPPKLRSYVVCFTNRCGSNLLGELISTHPDFEMAQEHLNAEQVLRIAQARGLKTLQEYIVGLHDQKASRAGILGVKLGYRQLYFLTRTGLMPHAFGNARFIHVQRGDVLAQAVSLVIASQTRVWTSKQAGKLKDPAYKELQIVRAMDGIHEANAKFRSYFDVYGIRPVGVLYEEMARDLQGTGDRVVRELGFSGTARARVRPEAITLRPQRDELNHEFISRIRARYDMFRRKAARPAGAQGGG